MNTELTRFALALCFFGISMIPQRTLAADVRPSIVGSLNLMPVTERRKDVRCAAGSYLSGLGIHLTDRMVGFSYKCVSNTADGAWNADSEVVTFGPGQVRNIPSRWHGCPRDYYVVSLAATTGTYAANSHGSAQPVPPPLIADLQPMCRLPSANPAIYISPRAYFEGAEDNKLQDIGAKAPPDPHACAPGTVAVGLLFAVDFRRDLDPPSQFQDVSLICERLAVSINKGLNKVPTH